MEDTDKLENNNNNKKQDKDKDKDENSDEDYEYGYESNISDDDEFNVYDVEENDDESEETDSTDDTELYQLSSEEEDIDFNHEDLNEDEIILPDDTLILMEIDGEDPGYLYEKEYSLIGLESSTPILKIGDVFYMGKYDQTFGTKMFFRNVKKQTISLPLSAPSSVKKETLEQEEQQQSSTSPPPLDEINNNNNTNSNANNEKLKSNEENVESLVYINKTNKRIVFYRVEVEKKKLINLSKQPS
ncbi:hypothetical protein CYY_001602 [Polysphondylium violaceum]|uniref:Transcription factor TFIIIC triple barrel domain-containing protein n=1 Tax=Polysphondylium violaceum TaxID=133409 RepID=A0A8J4PZK0_9MYCE|nr:hypothetical protein CYY_001602 [Polysphondylium violaceum]